MPALDAISVSIVLPLYKPQGQWAENFLQNLRDLNDSLPSGVIIDYIVVYDGMPENSIIETFREICRAQPGIKFEWYRQNRGKGHALRHGVRSSAASNVLTMDFDFPYRKESVLEMISLLKKGHEVIVGKRSNEYFQQIPVKRKVISKIFSWLATFFLGLPLRDTQSGIKGFNAKGKKVFLETVINRFLVDTEFILRACKKNLDMKTIRIEPKPDLSFTNFGFRVIRTELGNFLKLLYLNRSLNKQIH